MIIPGRVRNGVVIPDGGQALPEGAAVSISYPVAPAPNPIPENRRVQFPLVRTGEPGSVHLTNDRIAEILDEEDIFSILASGSL